MKFAFLFPGQGSQAVGMMAAYGDHPVLAQTFSEASDALGRDLWKLVSEGSADLINQTINTQPIMLTTGVAVWRLWKELGGPSPCIAAGHSLGEYSALVASGVITMQQAVPLVEFRAKVMQDAVPNGVGTMTAVLGLAGEKVSELCQQLAGAEVVEAVNFNAPEQTVIAGHTAAVERIAEACKQLGAKRIMPLPVSAPFHCTLMQPAAEKLAERLAEVEFSPGQFPVINNADVAMPDNPQDWRDALRRQAASHVRWVETIQAMQEFGVSHVYECGPGKVLAGLSRRCAPDLKCAGLFNRASLDETLSSFSVNQNHSGGN